MLKCWTDVTHVDDADDDDNDEQDEDDDEDKDEDEMLRCWTDVTHVDEYIFGWELSWLSLHDDADVNDDDDDDEHNDGDNNFDDEESRHDVSKFKSELKDDVDDDDVWELMHLEGDELT